MDTVDQVIRGHDSPRRSLADRNLKRTKVKLTEGPFWYHGIYRVALRLLLVGDKVFFKVSVQIKYLHRAWLEKQHTLNCCSHSLLLQTTDVLSGELSRQEWILGERLKISAAKGVTMQAYGRAEQDVGGSRFRLITQVLADIEQEVFVPCCCQ